MRKELLIKVCVCGNQFKVEQKFAYLRKFCSQACGYKYRVPRREYVIAVKQ